VLYENEMQAAVPTVPGLAPYLEMAGVVVRMLESCRSIWMFDPMRLRFCRLPRGALLGPALPERVWTPYYRLEVDASTGGFAVTLNEDGTHLLRSWFHVVDACCHCHTEEQTDELSLDVCNVG
jgi:hypothetical protein